jgi:hypothetical protein
MSHDNDPRQIPLAHLRHRCAEQTERFFRKEEHDDRYCFELFRRAFVDGSEQAWEMVYAQYHALVAWWVKAHKRFESTGEEVQYFVNGAFMSLSQACTPGNFGRFPNLQRLLSFLKACVHTAILGYIRDIAGPPTVKLPEELFGKNGSPIEGNLLQQEWRDEFWHSVNTRLNNEPERLVVEYCFILGLKPRELYAQFPGVFGDVREIYRLKQNLLERLGRDPDLTKFVGEAA